MSRRNFRGTIRDPTGGPGSQPRILSVGAFGGPLKEVARPMPERTPDSRPIQGVSWGVFCRFGTDGLDEPTRLRTRQGAWHESDDHVFIGSLANLGGVALRCRVAAIATRQQAGGSVASLGLDSRLGVAGLGWILLNFSVVHSRNEPPGHVLVARARGGPGSRWSALGHPSSGSQIPGAVGPGRRHGVVSEFARSGIASRGLSGRTARRHGF